MTAIQPPPAQPPTFGSPPPHGYYGPPRVVPTSTAAVVSLVLALVGLVTFGLTCIPAVIAGLSATADTRDGHRQGHGMAVSGIIVGGLQVAGWALFWVFYAIGSA